MRVVLVSFDMPWTLRGGVEHHVDRVASALAQDHGDDVTVVTRRRPPAGKRPYAVSEVAAGSAARWLGGDGYRFRLLAEPSFARRASRAAARLRPDVVHFQDFAGRPERVEARTAATIHVPHEVNLEEGRRALAEAGRLSAWRRRAMDRFHARLVRRARTYLAALDRVFTVSDENAAILRRGYGVRADVVPNGVDPPPRHAPTRAEARRLLGWESTGRVVLFLGRLEPAKQPLGLVPLAGPECRVVYAGDGSLADAVRSAAAKTRHVSYLGPLDEERKALALRAADVVALPSRSEGQPIVLLEALAAGTPVYATRPEWLPADLRRFGAFGPDVAAGVAAAARVRVPRGVVPTWSDVASRYRKAYAP